MIEQAAHQEFFIINLLNKPASRTIDKRLVITTLVVGVFLSVILQGWFVKKWEQQLNFIEIKKQEATQKIKQLSQLKQQYDTYIEELNQLKQRVEMNEETLPTLFLLFLFFEKNMPPSLFFTDIIYHEKVIEAKGSISGKNAEKDLFKWLHHFPSFAKVSLKVISYKNQQCGFSLSAQLL